METGPKINNIILKKLQTIHISVSMLKIAYKEHHNVVSNVPYKVYTNSRLASTHVHTKFKQSGIF